MSTSFAPTDSDLRRAAGDLEFSLAAPRDDAAIRAFLRAQPMHGPIQLAATTEPSFFAAAHTLGKTIQVLIARNRNAAPNAPILGLGLRTTRTLLLNAHPTRIGHLSFLRVDPTHRHHRDFLRTGYEFLHQLQRADPVPFHLTAILDDNLPAKRLLEANHRGMPRYTPLAPIRTFTISARTHRLKRYAPPLPLPPEQYPALLHCLAKNLHHLPLAPLDTPDTFHSHHDAPHWPHFTTLEQSGQITATAALWDQRPTRQLLITGYSPTLHRLRPLINLTRRLTNQPTLPHPNSPLNLAYISRLAIDDNHPRLFHKLLARLAAAARQKKIDYLALSLPAAHPLAPHAAKLAVHQTPSTLYAVTWPDESPPPHFSTPPYVEAALL